MGDTLLTGGDGGQAAGGGAPPAGGQPPAEDPRAWLPEEFRADPAFRDFRDLTGLAKSYKHAAGMVGLDKGQVLRLPAKEDAPEWGEVWNRLGRPENPDGYEVAAPEGLDEDGLKAFRETAHQLGLNKRQAAELMGFYGKRLEGLRAAAEEQAVQQAAEAQRLLKAEWGSAYEDRLHAVNRLIVASEGGEEVRQALNEAGLGRNPVVLKWLAGLAMQRAEPADLKGGAAGGMSRPLAPAEARAEIAALEASEEFQRASRDRDMPGRQAILEKRNRLYAMAYPQGNAA